MIVDLCKPLNAGESRTVRVIMTVDEARETLAVLTVVGASRHNLLEGIRDALTRNDHGFEGKEAPDRNLPRDQRQLMITNWARAAFGEAEATGIPQRGLRLLEEAIEAFQACGGDEAIAHKLVKYVFERPPGQIGQELGGVAVTVLALAAAAGLSADEEECREIHRVLSKPISEFTQRNASKNAAGFKMTRCPWAGCSTPGSCDGTRHT